MKLILYTFIGLLVASLLLLLAPFICLYFLVDRFCSLFETIFRRRSTSAEDDLASEPHQNSVWDDFLYSKAKNLISNKDAGN